MHAVPALLDAAARLHRAGEPYALATLLPPASGRLLVPADGEPIGEPVAGLDEAAVRTVVAHARGVLASGTPATVELDGGGPRVFVEPVPRAGHLDPLALLASASDRAAPAVLATVVDAEGRLAGSVGRRHLHFDDDTWSSDMRLHGLEEDVVLAAREVLDGQPPAIRPHTFEDGAAHVAYEYLTPAPPR